MTHALVLGRRALREGLRTPEAIVPTLFIPLFFLVVNVGQAARIFTARSYAPRPVPQSYARMMRTLSASMIAAATTMTR